MLSIHMLGALALRMSKQARLQIRSLCSSIGLEKKGLQFSQEVLGASGPSLSSPLPMAPSIQTLRVESTQTCGIHGFYTRNRNCGFGNILRIWVSGCLGKQYLFWGPVHTNTFHCQNHRFVGYLEFLYEEPTKIMLLVVNGRACFGLRGATRTDIAEVPAEIEPAMCIRGQTYAEDMVLTLPLTTKTMFLPVPI